MHVKLLALPFVIAAGLMAPLPAAAQEAPSLLLLAQATSPFMQRHCIRLNLQHERAVRNNTKRVQRIEPNWIDNLRAGNQLGNLTWDDCRQSGMI